MLSKAECRAVLSRLDGTSKLMAELIYGTGIRLMELLRLRVKDVDLDRQQLIVRGGKGDRDRVTALPESLLDRLRAHRDRLRQLFEDDRVHELPGAWLPESLERKVPGAGIAWICSGPTKTVATGGPSSVAGLLRRVDETPAHYGVSPGGTMPRLCRRAPNSRGILFSRAAFPLTRTPTPTCTATFALTFPPTSARIGRRHPYSDTLSFLAALFRRAGRPALRQAGTPAAT